MENEKEINAKEKFIDTSSNDKNGQEKCPKCGSTDISPTINGMLRCNFCRCEFEKEKVSGLVEDIKDLKGQVRTSGVIDIDKDSESIITLKCESCGAEVVIDTSNALQAKCHWCRNTLSINKQIPNSSVPDVLLPFKLTKEEARTYIENFVGKRKFFAHPTFKKEFTTENIMGVYFPYMLVDVNGHANLSGEGEHQTRRYTVGSDEHERTYYDADLYHVEREFDIAIKGLSIESNSDRLNTLDESKTNNIINSIMPFDTENCVKFDANYLKGYTSEKRDINVSDLKEQVETEAKDIARFAANESLKNYDRGVAWASETFDVLGSQWQAAYLPVWLYSYQEVKGSKKLLHYVAVNARTKETMGSVPIHMPKLILVSLVVEALSGYAMIKIEFENNWILLSIGVIYFIIMYARYRNSGARHTYETETQKEVTNLRKVDTFIKAKKRMTNSTMIGANNKRLYGTSTSKNILDKLSSKDIIDKVTKL